MKMSVSNEMRQVIENKTGVKKDVLLKQQRSPASGGSTLKAMK